MAKLYRMQGSAVYIDGEFIVAYVVGIREIGGAILRVQSKLCSQKVTFFEYIFMCFACFIFLGILGNNS